MKRYISLIPCLAAFLITVSLVVAMEPPLKKIKIVLKKHVSTEQETPQEEQVPELIFSISDNKEYSCFFRWVKQKSNDFIEEEKEEQYLFPELAEGTDKRFASFNKILRLHKDIHQNNYEYITLINQQIDPKANKVTKKEEVQTYIEYGEAIKTIFEAFKFQKTEIIKKKSFKKEFTHQNKKFEIGFDEMIDGPYKDLKFIKVQLKNPGLSIDEGNKEIRKLLRAAHLKKIKIYNHEYLRMLLTGVEDFGEELDLEDKDYKE